MSNYEESLAKLIDYTIQGVEGIVAFGQEQIPEVVRELLLWHFILAVMWSVIAVSVMVGCAFIIKKLFRDFKNKIDYAVTSLDDEETSNFWDLMMALHVFLGVISVIVFLVNLTTALKIYIAPKVYLLEYAAGIVK